MHRQKWSLVTKSDKVLKRLIQPFLWRSLLRVRSFVALIIYVLKVLSLQFKKTFLNLHICSSGVVVIELPYNCSGY
jgi:hypothetical protein